MAKTDYNDRLKDYVQVNERIIAFYEKYPNGSLQSSITHLTADLVVVKAWAYRDANDERPGIGHSSMQIPGSTPYTEGSEVENAETSAWGRALAALGFEVRRGVASRNEIENKQKPVDNHNARITENKFIDNGRGDREVLATEEDRKRLLAKAKQLMGEKEGKAWVKQRMTDLGVKAATDFQLHQFMMLMNELEALEAGEHVEFTEDEEIPF